MQEVVLAEFPGDSQKGVVWEPSLGLKVDIVSLIGVIPCLGYVLRDEGVGKTEAVCERKRVCERKLNLLAGSI